MNIAKRLRRQNEEAAVDPAAIAFRLFDKFADGAIFNAHAAIAPGGCTAVTVASRP